MPIELIWGPVREKTPAGRAARGGKERESPPPQPTSGIFVCIWTMLGVIIDRVYQAQWAGRGCSGTNFEYTRCLLRRGIPQELPPRAARPAGALSPFSPRGVLQSKTPKLSGAAG